MRRLTPISVLILVLSVWFTLQLVQKYLGWIGLIVVVLTAAMATATVWMLDHDRPRLASLHRRAICRPFIRVVAQLSGRQVPTDATVAGTAEAQSLALRTRADFDEAKHSLRKRVRGHDAVIDQIFNHLRDHVEIRTGKPTAEGSPRPLGVFLLVGSEGVGKRYLTTCLCEQLWIKGILITLDLAEEVPDHTTEMLAALSANPCATVLLENVDRATGRTLERLTRILADGRGRDPSSGAVIELGNALIVMTSTRGIATMKEQSENNTTSIQERLAAETPMDHPLLAQFDVIAACRRLDAWTRAEVVALIMKRECRRHGLELGYVAPEFLTREVAAINDAHGMALIPPRIARLLRGPLTKAVNAGVTHLDLN